MALLFKGRVCCFFVQATFHTDDLLGVTTSTLGTSGEVSASEVE